MANIYHPNNNEINDFRRHGALKIRGEYLVDNGFPFYEIDVSEMGIEKGFVWIKKEHPEKPDVILSTRQIGANHPIRKCLGIINGTELKKIRVNSLNYRTERFEFICGQ